MLELLLSKKRAVALPIFVVISAYWIFKPDVTELCFLPYRAHMRPGESARFCRVRGLRLSCSMILDSSTAWRRSEGVRAGVPVAIAFDYPCRRVLRGVLAVA